MRCRKRATKDANAPSRTTRAVCRCVVLVLDASAAHDPRLTLEEQAHNLLYMGCRSVYGLAHASRLALWEVVMSTSTRTIELELAQKLLLHVLSEAEQRQMAGQPLVRQLDDVLFHLRKALGLSIELDGD